MSFQETFDLTERSSSSRSMMRHLARVAQFYSLHYPYETQNDIGRDDIRLWSTNAPAHDNGPRTDRSHDEIFTPFSPFTPQEITEYVGDGTIVDVGAGRSRFLTHFDQAHKVALEPTPYNADFQESLGHTVIDSWAHNLGKILQPNSVRCLNFSYSMPYWSAGKSDSVETVQGIIDVLEPGGIALINPVLGGNTHFAAESIASTVKSGEKLKILEEIDPSSRWWSMNRLAFWEKLTDSPGDNKELRVAGIRNPAITRLSRVALPTSVVLQKR